MQWINTHTDTLRSPEYIASSAAERGAWFSVLGWCVTQENGGRILDGNLWKDRQWQQLCGVSVREVRNASHLLVVEGNDVVVKFYPTDKEEIVRKKRAFAKEGGKAKAANMAMAQATANGLSHAKGDALAYAKADGGADALAEWSAERERKGREYNPLPPLQGETGEESGPGSSAKGSDSSPSDEVEILEKKEKGAAALARARGLFRIRPGTPLDAAEKRAWEKNWRAVVATDEVGWKALEWWFEQPAESPVAKYRRRKLSYLLNSWNTEVQSAITIAQQNGVLRGLQGVCGAPEGWRGIVGELDPEFHCPDRWEELPEPVRRAVLEEVKKREGVEQ